MIAGCFFVGARDYAILGIFWHFNAEAGGKIKIFNKGEILF